MQITKTIPQYGQFAVIWSYNGLTWAENWRWNNGKVEILEENGDKEDWVVNDAYYDGGYRSLDLTFVVA